MNRHKAPLSFLALALLAAALTGCSSEATADVRQETTFQARDVADAVYAVVAGHRAVYTDLVVNRLKEENVLAAHEEWQKRKTLLLPAQLFRNSADRVNQNNVLVNYQLKSLWPVNKANGAESPSEQVALQAVVNDPASTYYSEETIDGVRHYVATYADLATSQSCVSCHNEHPQSPKRDFSMDDVMGAVIVKIPLN